ncbi:MAG: CDP-alcohol phosphatidyltransferase family protein [Bacteroidetes bacterium]|nr:CDP-alcohol phosphatidyltransferase family protein [Bacteroidota bacterium]
MAKKQEKSAARPPDRIWTPSNMLSFLRMLLVIPFALLLRDVHANQLLLAALALIAYATDLLDGWIARTFEGESRLGRVIDPLADKVFIIVAVIVMVAEEILPLWYVLIVVLRDVIILAGGLHLRNRTGILVQSTMLGKAAVVSIGLVLLAAIFTDSGHDTLFSLLMLVSLGLIAASLYTYGERYVSLLRGKGSARS